MRAAWRARFGDLRAPLPLAYGFDRIADQAEAGAYRGSAPDGGELYIPLRAGPTTYLNAVWASGLPAGTSRAIVLNTAPISFADLLPTGLHVSVRIIADRTDVTNRTPDNVAVIVELESLRCSGDVNVFYGDQVLPGAGEILQEVASPNQITTLYRITGLREDTPLLANGTAQLRGVARAVLSPDASVRTVITAALVVQRLRDAPLDLLRRSA